MLTQGLIAASALIMFSASLNADSVYVVNATNQFGTIDLGTGTFRQIGPNMPEAGTGLTPGPNGSLLTLGVAGNLESINPNTGVATVIGATGLGDCSSPTSPCGPNSASTITALGGTVYATDLANNLYRVNPSTGAATQVGPTGIPPLPFTLLATNPDGTFNAYDQAFFSTNGKLYATFDAFTVDSTTFTLGTVIIPNHLYQIDPATGAATLIGPTELNLCAVADVNGTFYAFNSGLGHIVTLDLANGGTSFIENFDPAAGILTGASPAPEPCSLAFATFGIAGLVAYRCRRQIGRTAIGNGVPKKHLYLA